MSVDQAFAFRRQDLLPLADQLRQQFTEASPFPHVVIDDFLPPDVLDAVLEEFPQPEQIDWQEFDSAREVKLALADAEQMGSTTRHLLAEFNSMVFTDFLTALTGIDRLIPDPQYSGGGLHQIRAGGFLKVHADFNKHPEFDLYRRLNAILYLNKDWAEEYGGHLQIWDNDMTRCEEKVLPVFNRLLIFATLDNAYHGHPDPVTCPPDRARRSMALYYYTVEQPEGGQDEHTTVFKARPGEEFNNTTRQALKRWVPPVVSDALRERRRR
jgi:Rps23 Pro-64 3,4-dihydroxylase Tpa1-like proline 4-hydroxylase